MPTEFEYKYVLSLDVLGEYHENRLKAMSRECRSIEQGVICNGPGMYLRIRRSTSRSKTDWCMTFKVKDADRTIEVETPLDGRDGGDLWKRCYWKLKKDRFVIAEGGLNWEVDLFRDGDRVYFVLAEVELAEGSSRPQRLPDFIRKYLLYEVPLTDDRFSNKRLGDVEYAAKLYRQTLELPRPAGRTP